MILPQNRQPGCLGSPHSQNREGPGVPPKMPPTSNPPILHPKSPPTHTQGHPSFWDTLGVLPYGERHARAGWCHPPPLRCHRSGDTGDNGRA